MQPLTYKIDHDRSEGNKTKKTVVNTTCMMGTIVCTEVLNLFLSMIVESMKSLDGNK